MAAAARPAGPRARRAPVLAAPAPTAGARRRCRTRGTPATTASPASSAPSAGTARTSGCRIARAALAWIVALRVGQLPRDGLAQRPPARRPRRRLPAVRARPPSGAQAQRRQPARRARRQPPPARRPDRPAGRRSRSRPAAGGTTAGSCARSTCARVDRVDIDERAGAARRCAAPRCAATVLTRATVRNIGDAQRARPPSPAASAARRSTRHVAIAPRASATFTQAARGRSGRSCGRPAHPYLYGVRLTASAAQDARKPTPAAGYTLRTGIRSIKVTRGGRLLLNGQRRELPRRRDARGLTHAGLRDRQRHARAAWSRSCATRRDAHALPLPAAPVHAGAGRPARAC